MVATAARHCDCPEEGFPVHLYTVIYVVLIKECLRSTHSVLGTVIQP